jgi:hypothetical protein
MGTERSARSDVESNVDLACAVQPVELRIEKASGDASTPTSQRRRGTPPTASAL